MEKTPFAEGALRNIMIARKKNMKNVTFYRFCQPQNGYEGNKGNVMDFLRLCTEISPCTKLNLMHVLEFAKLD